MKNRVFSIGPDAAFLPTLVEAVINGNLLADWPKDGLFWLSDIVIILPTRRARLALAEAFATALGGAALLPDIRTFDGEPGDEEPFLEPAEAPLPPDAISPMERRFLLTQMITAWAKNHPDAALLEPVSGQVRPVRILQMADTLARLIDDFAIERVSPAALREIIMDELPENGRLNMRFLEIALGNWPKILAERNQVDASELRNLRLKRQAETLKIRFGERPVIAAGSTGSMPATAELMRSILRLERGVLVLPGLDTGLGGDSFARLLDKSNAPHGHPQYGLAQLLRRLGQNPQNVTELAFRPKNRRTELVRASLALAEETADWHQTRQKFSRAEIKKACQGVTIAVARSEQEQALVIAVAAQKALGKNQTVGVIAPDRNLARRIIAELKRFDIEVDDSAGMALFQSRAGRLARQVLAIVASSIGPVDLMALLSNRHVSLGYGRKRVSHIGQMIEFSLLRGQQPTPGFAGLRALLAQNAGGCLPHAAHHLTAEESKLVLEFLGDLEGALKPVCALLAGGDYSSAQLGAALVETLNALGVAASGESPAPLPGVRELNEWARALSEVPVPGPALGAVDAEAVLEVLMSGYSVIKPGTSRRDIAIWGRLEARLQTADLMVLSALNEGSWPEVADPGPWLSRGMRLKAGLEPPERQHGLAAHDFEMGMGCSNVLLTCSERIGTSPAATSRLLQRFLALGGKEAANAMRARGEELLQIARRLDRVEQVIPATRAPSPPAALRPKSLSITEVETLIRSPYELYAKYVLALTPLDPLGEEAGARERGTLVHEVFARFVEQGHDVMARQAEQILVEIAADVFGVLAARPERRDIWLRRFTSAIEGFLAFERSRNHKVRQRYAEKKLRWTFQVAGTDFTLRGRADRIDVLSDNSFEIIDFKTGSVPGSAEMRNFLAPQLLLEAAIAGARGFENTDPAPTSALTYIKIGAGPKAFVPTGFVLAKNMDIKAASEEILNRVQSQVEAYLLSDTHPMHARLLPKPNQSFRSPYEHLARSDEWTLNDYWEGED